MSDRDRKLARLRRILDARGADRLELTALENLTWLLDGARVCVPFGGAPVLTATVHRDGRIVVTASANEVERLAAEELGDGVEVLPAPWFEPLPVGDGLLDTEVARELRAARAVLLPDERERYRALGRDLAVMTTGALRTARREDTETDLAARLAAGVVRLGAEPVVLLVAGASRLHHRHPLPNGAPLGGRAMVAIGARRCGLVTSLTRWLDLDGAGPDPRTEALLEVEADALAATRPGRELRAVLDDIRTAYTRHGFDASTWLEHHQGGPTGYAGRDPKATPSSRETVAAGQAFAWNPTARGAKVEDTVVVDTDSVEVLTVDPAWPTTTVRGLARPLPLVPDPHHHHHTKE